ncbi:MAG TPA: hypothetical protein VIG62_09105 [Blastocatellia bacterium]|jgi:hypothetical protein
MKSGSQLVKASIGNKEARIINTVHYELRPLRPDTIGPGGYRLQDPVKKAVPVRVEFDDIEFMRDARQLFQAQIRDPNTEPPLLYFNAAGENIRGVIQRVSFNENWLQVSLDG